MNFFIDTNVFVDWILVNEVKNRMKIENKNLKTIIPFYDKIEPSFVFLEKIFRIKKHSFYTSPFCIFELSRAIIRHAVKRRMYEENVSFNYFSKYEKFFVKKEKNLIYAILDLFYKKFLQSKNILLINKKSYTKKHFLAMDFFQVELSLSYQDSLILLDSLNLKEYVFITSDSDFLNKKNILEKELNIVILHPKEALKILK